MEMKLLDSNKNRIQFSFEGANHTVCNALKMALWDNKDVKAAGYNVSHPLVGTTEFVVETKSGDAKKAVTDALANLKKEIANLKKQAGKF